MREKTQQIIAENLIRLNKNKIVYNQYTGEGCTEQERVKIEIEDAPFPIMYIPKTMMDCELIIALNQTHSIAKLITSINGVPTEHNIDVIWREFIKIRIKHDFPFWCAMYAVIKDKITARDIPFIFNRAQRKLLKAIWDMWLRDVPIRIILLKARQWGGSTLIQIFFIYVQLVHIEQWNSVICAHVENTAKVIRGMYSKLLKSYPIWLIDKEVKGDRLKLTPFEDSHKTKHISEIGCKITVGSAENSEGIRGDDGSMAHLSEVALWKSTAGSKPEDLEQAIIGGIAMSPKTFIAYESTAKGVGNFFHRKWLAAKRGETNYNCVFVAWFEIDIYQKPLSNYGAFIDTMTEYEMWLFSIGATLEAISWYREKRKEFTDEWRMKSEYPSDDVEAFQSTGNRVFPLKDVSALRKYNKHPKLIGDIFGADIKGQDALKDLNFEENVNGKLSMWEMPDNTIDVSERYLVVVDVGKGRTVKADNSVIVVFDRYWMLELGVPEVVAEWCGHIDMDILAWKAAQISKFYCDALLVIESNTIESNMVKGDSSEFIIEEIYEYYDNIYRRPQTNKLGFHTNHSTKKSCINQLLALMRDSDQYVERNSLCCDEMDTYETKDDGSMGAVEGCHDDRVMTRAIGMYVCYKHMDVPKLIDRESGLRLKAKTRIISEATI